MTDEERINAAIEDVLRTESGKRVIFWFIGLSSVFADPFAGPGGGDVTTYKIGAQSVGRAVINALDEIDPKCFPTLLFDMARIREADAKFDEIERGNEEENDDA